MKLPNPEVFPQTEAPAVKRRPGPYQFCLRKPILSAKTQNAMRSSIQFFSSEIGTRTCTPKGEFYPLWGPGLISLPRRESILPAARVSVGNPCTPPQAAEHGAGATEIRKTQKAMRSSIQFFSSEIGTRTCSMVSRSRMVTALSAGVFSSPTVWKSTVTQKGVPISSSRR